MAQGPGALRATGRPGLLVLAPQRARKRLFPGVQFGPCFIGRQEGIILNPSAAAPDRSLPAAGRELGSPVRQCCRRLVARSLIAPSSRGTPACATTSRASQITLK